MTASPSFNSPLTTSVAVPSEIPDWIGTASGSPEGLISHTVLAETDDTPPAATGRAPLEPGVARSPPDPELPVRSDLGGVNRSAAFGTLRTCSLRAPIIDTFAVMPGFRRRSRLSTPTTTLYVTTFCTLLRAFLTCRTRSLNCSPGYASPA